jgi:signal transduction histidine kinase
MVHHPDGSIAYFSSVIQDITQPKRAGELLKKSESELRALNIQKDKFFSIIAHDLKSPFNAIMGYSEFLVEQIKANDYEELDKYAEIILQSSQRALDLLMNLMEWSRAQTGRIEFNPGNFLLVDFFDGVTSLFDNIAGQKLIGITANLPPNKMIYADKQMLSTVMRNLISNAIKFTLPGGRITITAIEKPGELIISVSDTGVGISKTNIEKLFRIDENYSTPGTNSEKGTGLGLILCKEFVEKHGGKIWVESHEGKGSTFYVALPHGHQTG